MNLQLIHRRVVRCLYRVAFTACCLLLSLNAMSQLTPGNLVVLQAGGGSTALGSGGTEVFLKEFTTAGTPVNTIAVPATGIHRLVINGTAPTEGFLTLSADSSRLVLAGYDTTTAYAAGISGSNPMLVARVIDTVSAYGLPGRADTTRGAAGTGSIRAAARGAGEHYWMVGASSGVYYLGNLQAPGPVASASTDSHFLLPANGNLYYCSPNFLYKFTGHPTAAVTPTVLLNGLSNACSFAISTNESVIYVADERAAVNGGGIQKWVYTGTVWNLSYTITPSVTPVGARSVIADWSGATPVLYAITTDNRLVKFTDPGTLSGVTSQVLATAPLGSAFRSVAFAPKAAAGCISPVFAGTVTSRTCDQPGAVSLTVASAGSTSFSWTGPGGFSAATQNINGLPLGGIYTVTARVPGGCSTVSSFLLEDSTQLFKATISGQSSLCAGDTTTLQANGGAGYTYQFKLAGAPVASGTSQTLKTSIAGSYTVTVTSGPYCTATSIPLTVTTMARPPAVISPAGPIIACSETVITLRASRSNTYAYQWVVDTDTVTGVSTNDSTVRFNYVSGGVRVIVTNAVNGCKAVSAPVVVSLYPHQDTSVTPAAGMINICTGDSVRFHVPATAGSTYQWKNAAGNIIGAKDTVFRTGTADDYTVVLTSVHGCVDSSRVHTVVINERPTATISASADTACQRSRILVDAPTGPNYAYQWYFADTVFASGINTFPVTALALSIINVPIKDSIRVVVTNAAGCTDTSAWKVLVFRSLPSPVIYLNAGVLATIRSYASYQWIKDGAVIPGATGATYLPVTDGWYNVAVTDAFGCSDTSLIPMPVNSLGVAGPSGSSNRVSVYPNPAIKQVTVSAHGPVNIRLVDMQGRIVMAVQDGHTLDLTPLTNGIYTMMVIDDRGRPVEKIRLTKTGG